MSEKFDDIKIEYRVSNGQYYPIYHFKVYTPQKGFAKISGHRFVNLVDYKNVYQNDLSTLLGFIGKAPFIENDYMKVGNALEIPIAKASEEWFGLENVKYDFGFDDLKNGTADYHFIRDMMYEKDGETFIGEIKTFYNRKKVNLSDGVYPKPHISWWLQTRLECEILNLKGRIFFYYVTKGEKQKVLDGKAVAIKPKYLYQSEIIIPHNEYEPTIAEHFDELGFSTFGELMAYAEMRKEELADEYYEDEQGGFYYVQVPVKDAWWGNKDPVEKYIDDLSTSIEIKEMGYEKE